MSKATLFISLIVCSLIAALAQPARGQWQQVYAENSGDIESLASNAKFIFAGTDSGVFRSSNEGDTWLQVNNGLLEEEVYALGISKKGNLFGGTEHHGVFRTTNAGDTWTEQIKGLPDSNTIFAVVGDRSGNVYAGSATDGVFYSSDEGDHWNFRSVGLMSTYVWSMIVTPANELIVGLSGEIAKTNDSAMHWTRLDSLAPTNEVLSLACDSQSVLYAGLLTGEVLRSSDNGAHWIAVAFSPRHKPVRNIATQESTVYAATYGDGILISTDRGLNWKSANDGLTDTLLYRLTISPKGNVFCGTYTAKVFRSLPLLDVSSQHHAIGYSVYPNPARDHVLIATNGIRIDAVTLFDCLGRQTTREVRSGKIDVSDLPNGIYYARFEAHEMSATQVSASFRFVVSH